MARALDEPSLFLIGLILDQLRYCQWAGWIVMNAAGLVLFAGFVGMLVEMRLVVASSVDYMSTDNSCLFRYMEIPSSSTLGTGG